MPPGITIELLERASCRLYNIGTGVATSYLKIAEMIDRDNIKFVPNPLSSYQHYTRAETASLKETLGDYSVIGLEQGIRSLVSLTLH